MGELTKAYKMLTKAIEIDEKDENDSEFIMNIYYMATLCTDFVANGYDKYIPKADQCYKTVMRNLKDKDKTQAALIDAVKAELGR